MPVTRRALAIGAGVSLLSGAARANERPFVVNAHHTR